VERVALVEAGPHLKVRSSSQAIGNFLPVKREGDQGWGVPGRKK